MQSPKEPRLQTFPRGLGKGSDSAVVGAWLETVLDDLPIDQVPVPSPDSTIFLFGGRLGMNKQFLIETMNMIPGLAWTLFEEMYQPMLRVLKWGNKATNNFFRTVYAKGDNLWIHRSRAVEAVEDCWAMTDPC